MVEILVVSFQLESAFPLLNCLLQVRHWKSIVRSWSHLGLWNLALPFVIFRSVKALVFKMFNNHAYTLFSMIAYFKSQDHWRAICLLLSQLDCNFLLNIHALFYLFNRMQGRPCHQFCDTSVLFRLVQQQYLVRCHDKVNVDVLCSDLRKYIPSHLVASASSLLVLFNARVNSALSIALPNLDLVV